MLLNSQKVSKLVVVLDETDKTDEVASRLEQLLPGIKAKRWYDMATFYNAVVRLYNAIFGFLGVIIFVIVVLSSSNTMMMSIFERTREIGTQLAVGTSPLRLMINFLYEGLIVGVSGGGIGLIIALLFATVINASGILMPAPPGSTRGYPSHRRFGSVYLRRCFLSYHRDHGYRHDFSCLQSVTLKDCRCTRTCLIKKEKRLKKLLRIYHHRTADRRRFRAAARAKRYETHGRRNPAALRPNRNGWTSYSVMTTIINYEDNELKEEGLFEVSIKGMDKTLVKFMNADVKGEYLLMVDDDMWIYMPNTRKPIRITPLQRLMGNASNGDVARTRYAEDYSAKLIKEESVNGVPCYVLELNAKRDGATYKKIDYWVEKETKRPKKAEMYLLSGKHFKSITFDRYEETAGKSIAQPDDNHRQASRRKNDGDEIRGVRRKGNAGEIF